LSTDVVIARTLPYRASAPNFLVGVLTREGSGPARGRPALIDPSQATSKAIIGPPPIAVAIRPVIAVVVGPVNASSSRARDNSLTPDPHEALGGGLMQGV